MTKEDLYATSYQLLKQIYGQDAEFKDGQYEAIQKTIQNKRTLVVQKTGWGKSLVYFISTKLLRQSGKGVTLVVSPLLVLMENQMEAAIKMGLQCDVLNSTVKHRRGQIIEAIIADQLDLVFITPESLFSHDFQSSLKDINIGLFVIDEAHCISDWGHDFRLEYSSIYKILKIIPTNVPILATTATANNRVVDDLKRQLGEDVFVSRGELMRKSLSIQVLKLPSIASRYAWILENINKINGTGIIYCLTQRDCDYLTTFLEQNNILARSYYSRNQNEEYLNQEAEQLFLQNRIKVIVATIKLGMGYDKGDIGFIIHFQQPANIVSYYQQIGRAGRNINRAYTFLMTGYEDREIQNYFINTAFPTKLESENVNDYIFENTDTGVTRTQLIANINSSSTRIDKALMFLQNEDYIVKEKNKYYATSKVFTYNDKHYNEITAIRKKEQKQMDAFIITTECYNKFIVNCLDDLTTQTCGICANCLGYDEFPTSTTSDNLEKAQCYLEQLMIPIEPRKQWATTSLTRQTKIATPNETGLCLSKYGDPGYGSLVKRDKYSTNGYFCDELIGKTVSLLKPMIKQNNIQAIAYVPSLRSDIVADFACKVAKSCGIPYLTLLDKTSANPQKQMLNSSHQCENALQSFHPVAGLTSPENVILIDDIIDSRWTFTVCGNILVSMGAMKVFPFALADSSNREE